MANRVGEIQRLTESKDWRHVASSENPADILSLSSRELTNLSLWHRPSFLQTDDSLWPTGTFTRLGEGLPELRKMAIAAIVQTDTFLINDLLSRFANLNKICRIIVAYCLWLSKVRRPAMPTEFISPDKFSHALKLVYKDVQRQEFLFEHESLLKGEAVRYSSRLLSLSPFMDEV